MASIHEDEMKYNGAFAEAVVIPIPVGYSEVTGQDYNGYTAPNEI